MLVSSRAKLTGIGGTIALNGRNGECTITQSRGPIDASLTNLELTITEHTGAIKVSGDGGALRVARPSADLAVDVKRMLVEVTLAAPLAATIMTSEEPLRLTLAGPPRINLDAVVTERRHSGHRLRPRRHTAGPRIQARRAHRRRRPATRAAQQPRGYCDRACSSDSLSRLCGLRCLNRSSSKRNLSGLTLARRGKVRDVYDLGEQLLIVATDRISAFDYILGSGIPDKGKRPHAAVGVLVRADWRPRAASSDLSIDVDEFPA